MPPCQSLPRIWVLSDARNDAGLDQTLRTLPAGCGLVFRHYHLDEPARQSRYHALRSLCRSVGHLIVLAGDGITAAAWEADGLYGPAALERPAAGLLRLTAVHNGMEIDRANQAGVDGMLLSPVFATRSHPDATTLGIAGFHILAQRATRPVIALGGMTAARAAELDWPRWAAIDAFCDKATRRNPVDS